MKIQFKIVILVIVCVVLGMFIGFWIGAYFGVNTLIDHVGNALQGSTFTINLNETKLVEEFNKTIYPQMQKYLLNTTNG